MVTVMVTVTVRVTVRINLTKDLLMEKIAQGIEPPPIDKLAMALSKAQALICPADKDGKAPYGKFATLSACWAACRKALTDNQLSVVQIPRTDGNIVTIKTILLHSSGQSIEGDLSCVNQNTRNMAQGIGSAITYLKRYALCGFVGVTPADDDDGAAAGAADGEPAPRQQGSKQASPPPRQQQPTARQGPSDAQLKRLYALTAESTWSADDVKAVMKQKYKVESSKDLSQAQYQEICDALIKETP
jgi:hypothetical protein